MMNTPSALLFTVFVSLLFIAVEPSVYLGCFTDSPKRIFPESKTDFPKSLTLEVCLNLCVWKGFRYAGVEYGVECFCSNTPPSTSVKAKEKDCNMPCAGNSRQTCGGSWRLGVYDSREFYTGKYLGCLKDNPQRVLQDKQINFPETLTVEVCVSFCMKNGFRYAGVEYGIECFCSDSRPSPFERVNEENCNKPCIGDEKQFCGGSWHISVYDRLR